MSEYKVEIKIDRESKQVICEVVGIDKPIRKTFCAFNDTITTGGRRDEEDYIMPVHKAWKFSEGLAFGITSVTGHPCEFPSVEEWRVLDKAARAISDEIEFAKAKKEYPRLVRRL